MKFLSDTPIDRERARVLDEKFIPAYKNEVSWPMGDFIPHLVLTRFQACIRASGWD